MPRMSDRLKRPKKPSPGVAMLMASVDTSGLEDVVARLAVLADDGVEDRAELRAEVSRLASEVAAVRGTMEAIEARIAALETRPEAPATKQPARWVVRRDKEGRPISVDARYT